VEQSIEFEHKDLLISRTDSRGVIMSANDAFMRVSGFSEKELTGAPHKIVRHPDMPRGLFYLLWEQIQAGNPVGAYVKNRAKDGGSYWVFAMVSPLEDGFISIRIRASKKGVAIAEQLYSPMLAQEKDPKITPQVSAGQMVVNIQDGGYQSYPAFMSERFVAEMSDRERAIGRKAAPQLEHLTSALEDWNGVGQRCNEIFETYKNFEVTPLNMKIQAGHLGDAGSALSEIASNFAGIANGIKKELQSYTSSASDVAETLYACLFQNFAQAIMSEACDLVANSEDSRDAEFQIIRNQRREYSSRASDGLCNVLDQLSAFIRGSSTIKRQLSGLSVTRIMCAIEIAQIGGDARGNISAMVNDLRQFEDQAGGKMKAIEDCLHSMDSDLTSIQSLEELPEPSDALELAH